MYFLLKRGSSSLVMLVLWDVYLCFGWGFVGWFWWTVPTWIPASFGWIFWAPDVGILLTARAFSLPFPMGNHRIIWVAYLCVVSFLQYLQLSKKNQTKQTVEQMLPDQTPLSSVIPLGCSPFPVIVVGFFHTSRSVWISICHSYYEGQSRPINLTFLVFKKQAERYPFQKFGKWKHRIFSQKGHFLEDHSRTCK